MSFTKTEYNKTQEINMATKLCIGILFANLLAFLLKTTALYCQKWNRELQPYIKICSLINMQIPQAQGIHVLDTI